MAPEAEVADGVFRLGNRFVNWWVVKDDDGLTIVDAGLPKHMGQLDELLTTLGVTTGDIRAILLTHADLDHIGVAEQLRAGTDANVYLHPVEEKEATGEPRPLPAQFAANMWRSWLRDTTAAYLRDGALKPEFLTTVVPLVDGQALDAPGRPTVVHCPGHTPGSCAFHLPERDVVFTGDALVTVSPVTGDRGPQLMPDFDNDDPDSALESLGRLAALDATTVLSGHGEPWSGGLEGAIAQIAGTAYPQIRGGP
jgi:glyoxylase-like metal-dependent hydrolase (beta-lactamase superfamily II)